MIFKRKLAAVLAASVMLVGCGAEKKGETSETQTEPVQTAEAVQTTKAAVRTIKPLSPMKSHAYYQDESFSVTVSLDDLRSSLYYPDAVAEMGIDPDMFAVDMTVKVKNIRSAKGKVMIAADKGQYAMADATGDTVTLVLKEVPEGKCKLYVYHDENGNYQLDLEDGIPAENCAIVDLDMTAEAKTIDVELKDVKALQDKAKK